MVLYHGTIDASGQPISVPQRPDVNFASMQEERAKLEEIAANPKPGYTPGCPGCRN